MGKMNYDNYKEEEVRDNIKVDINPIKIFSKDQEEICKKLDQTNCKNLQDVDLQSLIEGISLAYDYINTMDVRPKEISDILNHIIKCRDKLLEEKRRRERNNTVLQLSKKQKMRSSKLAEEEANLTKDLKEAKEKKKTEQEEQKTKEKKIKSAEDFIKHQKEERKKTSMQTTEEEKEEEIPEWRKTTVPEYILPDTSYNRELQKLYEKKFYA